ncbi:MAG: YfiR family protein [Betaproteobacteria bacterium]|nr:YfiR family protein [Betaproteobacteria bacterium]
MKKPFFFLLVFICASMAAAPPSFLIRAARGADVAGTQDSKLLPIFWGIVGYTRWPDMNGALRICLSGEDRHSTIIRQSARSVELGRQVIVRSTPENAASACNIVYVSGAGMDAVGELLRSLAGAPVLTIGDGDRFCRMGGMFCLLSGGEGSSEKAIDRFAVNEKAISSSPLQINPQVLRLSKRNRER